MGPSACGKEFARSFCASIVSLGMSDFPSDFNGWSDQDKKAYYNHRKDMADARKAEAEARKAEAEARKAEAEDVARKAKTTGEFILLDNIL